jgi:hypothetical protein
LKKKAKEENVSEQLLKNSHDIYIGQQVRVLDRDVLDILDAYRGEVHEYAMGTIMDIDGEDIKIKIETDLGDVGGWNLDFSVIW